MSARAAATPSALLRSSTTLFLLRLTEPKVGLYSTRPQPRNGSPPSGDFDLDHLGAEIAKQHSGIRAGNIIGEFDDADAVERRCHGVPR